MAKRNRKKRLREEKKRAEIRSISKQINDYERGVEKIERRMDNDPCYDKERGCKKIQSFEFKIGKLKKRLSVVSKR